MSYPFDDEDFIDNGGDYFDAAEQPNKKRRRSTKGRSLMRWDVDKDQYLLLLIEHVSQRENVPIPWDMIGALLTPKLTAEAIKQHLAKVRKARIESGYEVPPALDKHKCVRRKSKVDTRSLSSHEEEKEEGPKRSTLLPPRKNARKTIKSARRAAPRTPRNKKSQPSTPAMVAMTPMSQSPVDSPDRVIGWDPLPPTQLAPAYHGPMMQPTYLGPLLPSPQPDLCAIRQVHDYRQELMTASLQREHAVPVAPMAIAMNQAVSTGGLLGMANANMPLAMSDFDHQRFDPSLMHPAYSLHSNLQISHSSDGSEEVEKNYDFDFVSSPPSREGILPPASTPAADYKIDWRPVPNMMGESRTHHIRDQSSEMNDLFEFAYAGSALDQAPMMSTWSPRQTTDVHSLDGTMQGEQSWDIGTRRTDYTATPRLDHESVSGTPVWSRQHSFGIATSSDSGIFDSEDATQTTIASSDDSYGLFRSISDPFIGGHADAGIDFANMTF